VAINEVVFIKRLFFFSRVFVACIYSVDKVEIYMILNFRRVLNIVNFL